MHLHHNSKIAVEVQDNEPSAQMKYQDLAFEPAIELEISKGSLLLPQ